MNSLPTFALPGLRARFEENPDIAIFPVWAHRSVRYWAPVWLKIRDCLLGEQEIKEKGETYLPRMAQQDDDDFAAYKDRAVFFNMVTRTINAIVGQMFEKAPEYDGVPKALDKALKTICYENYSLDAFVCMIAEALCGLGRFGVLLDQDAAGEFPPYLRGYETENILDWQIGEINGRRQPVQIVLREFVQHLSRKVGSTRSLDVIFRVLSLDIDDGKPVYRQYVYTINTLSAGSQSTDLSQLQPEVITPMSFGVPFDHIPFQAFGAKINTIEVDRPPAADIVDLNLAHYKAYAHLEHGRWFTATPVYWVSRGAGGQEAEYALGPATVWEVGLNEKAGLLEFNGQGLKTLESSCAQKEDQIAMIGARLMGGYSRSTSESDQQAAIKESNERSLSCRIIDNINEGMSNILTAWAKWQGQDDAEIACKINTAFLSPTPDARAIRAAQMLYEAGAIPISQLHQMMQIAGYVSEECDVDTFKKLLAKVEEFPNNPDVWARQKGYADAANRHAVNLQRRTLRDTEDRTAILQQQASTDKKDVEGNLDIDQQKVDVAQQQVDVAEQAQDTAAKALKLQQQQGGAAGDTVSVSDPSRNPIQAKTTIGGPVPGAPGASPNSKPLPGQVADARQAGSAGGAGVAASGSTPGKK